MHFPFGAYQISTNEVDQRGHHLLKTQCQKMRCTRADVLSDQLEIPSQTAPVGDGHLMPIFLLVSLSRIEELSTRQGFAPGGRSGRALAPSRLEGSKVGGRGRPAAPESVSLGARAKPGAWGGKVREKSDTTFANLSQLLTARRTGRGSEE